MDADDLTKYDRIFVFGAGDFLSELAPTAMDPYVGVFEPSTNNR